MVTAVLPEVIEDQTPVGEGGWCHWACAEGTRSGNLHAACGYAPKGVKAHAKYNDGNPTCVSCGKPKCLPCEEVQICRGCGLPFDYHVFVH